MYGACVRRDGHLTCKRVKKIFTYQHSKELITLENVMLNIFTPYGCFIPLKSVQKSPMPPNKFFSIAMGLITTLATCPEN